MKCHEITTFSAVPQVVRDQYTDQDLFREIGDFTWTLFIFKGRLAASNNLINDQHLRYELLLL